MGRTAREDPGVYGYRTCTGKMAAFKAFQGRIGFMLEEFFIGNVMIYLLYI
jgi:hypothetical protein